MSGRKTVIIALMVLIIIAVGLIFFMSRQNTSDPEKRLEDAQKYYDMLDYDKAIAVYNEILSGEKSCVEAYIGLADAYMVKGNEDKAAEILERGFEATNGDTRIAAKISEFSEEYSAEITESETAVTAVENQETEETTVITTTVTETEKASETTTEQTEETTETTTVTTVTTTETTTVTTVPTTKATTVTTVPTTARTTVRQTQVTPKPTIKMPNFIGLSKDEVFELAEESNIMIVFEYEKNDTYANNVVFHQSHRAGTMVSEQTPVYAYVCVNDKKLVTEDDKNVEAFYKAAESWGSSNSDKVKSVDFAENTSTVTINASSMKRFIIDESVMEAFKKCDDAFLRIKSSDVNIVISSASVTSSDKLDLSANVSGNDSRTTLEIGSNDKFNCALKVTIYGCKIRENQLVDMYVYCNNKKHAPVELNIDNEPVINISKGGTYVIK